MLEVIIAALIVLACAVTTWSSWDTTRTIKKVVKNLDG